MSHPSAETLAAYWLSELPEADALALEEHLFGCEPCTAHSARMAALPRALSFAVAPVVTSAQAARLLARDARIKRILIEPGGRGVVDFSKGAEAQLVALKADLRGATQVDVKLCTRDGTAFRERADVPFDAEAGTVTIACRGYYLSVGFPLEVSVRLEATLDGTTRSLGVFDIDHIPPP